MIQSFNRIIIPMWLIHLEQLCQRNLRANCLRSKSLQQLCDRTMDLDRPQQAPKPRSGRPWSYCATAFVKILLISLCATLPFSQFIFEFTPCKSSFVHTDMSPCEGTFWGLQPIPQILTLGFMTLSAPAEWPLTFHLWLPIIWSGKSL